MRRMPFLETYLTEKGFQKKKEKTKKMFLNARNLIERKIYFVHSNKNKK